MPGTSSAKTRFALLPGHDELWPNGYSIGCISSETLRLSAASQILRPRIALSTGRAKGGAETPFVVNRKIGRPPRALHAAGAARVGQSAPHLIERGLGNMACKIRGPPREPRPVPRSETSTGQMHPSTAARSPCRFSPAELIIGTRLASGPRLAHGFESGFSWL